MGKNPLEYSQSYLLKFRKLSKEDQNLTKETISFFTESMHHPNLRTHGLRREEYKIRSITVHGDLRILLRVRDDESILLIDVGSHDEVYLKL
jgi:mRNA-degrading endonuclease YafQ of YafQ-DinJ toxin-antitoxin module